MALTRPVRLAGRALLAAIPSVGLAAAAALLAGSARATWARARAEAWSGVDAPLAGICASVGTLVCLWLCLGTAVSIAAQVVPAERPLGRWARRCAEQTTPRVVRRVTAALIGVALVGGGAGAAQAAARPPLATAASETDLDPGWAPTATTQGPDGRTLGATSSAPPTAVARADRHPAAASAGAAAAPGGSRRVVVVHRGDTLWRIAARDLASEAPAARVAREWPGWFEANRDVIGDDPDRLRPGQRLRAPASGSAGDADHAAGGSR